MNKEEIKLSPEMSTITGEICPMKVVTNMIAGKWKILILWYLQAEPRRFGELQRLLPNVSKGVLTQQLKQLEKDKLINRQVYNEVPLKVVYSLSEVGESLSDVLDVMQKWGNDYLEQ